MLPSEIMKRGTSLDIQLAMLGQSYEVWLSDETNRHKSNEVSEEKMMEMMANAKKIKDGKANKTQ